MDQLGAVAFLGIGNISTVLDRHLGFTIKKKERENGHAKIT